MVRNHAGWIDGDVDDVAVGEGGNEVQRSATDMRWAGNVLHEVKRRQQVGKPSRIRVSGVLDVDVNVAADDDKTVLHHELLENG